jgi:hypothetical protein
MHTLDTALLAELLELADALDEPHAAQLLAIAAALMARPDDVPGDPLSTLLDTLTLGAGQWLWAQQLMAMDEAPGAPPDPALGALAAWLDQPPAPPAMRLRAGLEALRGLPASAPPRAMEAEIMAALSAPTRDASRQGSGAARAAARDAARAALRLLDRVELLDELLA